MDALDPGARARLACAAERILKLFWHDENVAGVGVGYRRRGGKLTNEPVVTVMVRKKRRPALVSRRRMIPTHIDMDGTSYATDVVQAQAMLMHADETPPQNASRQRPLVFGTGVSNFSDARPDAGTIGAFVRDNNDGTTCILSANHVIADNNGAPTNDPIYQPAKLDWEAREEARTTTIGRLKRWVTITGGATAVDAAIAQVNEGVEVAPRYESNHLTPPSRNRKAIGMVVAGDGFGNVWLTRMSTTLTELRATLLPDERGANLETEVPRPGTVLQKVGRTTNFTVGRVLETGVSVNVEVEGVGTVRYTDLIKVQWLGWNGDSGAMALWKKNAEINEPLESGELESQEEIRRIIEEKFETCPALESAESSFGVRLTEDAELSDEVRDEFLALSDTGRYLITLTYLNTTLFRSRMERRVEAEKQAYAQALYEEYRPVVAELMANPESRTRITQQDGEGLLEMLALLRQTGTLRAEEEAAAVELCRQHESGLLNRGRRETIEYMNRSETLLSTQTTARRMTALRLAGTARNLTSVD